MAYLSHARCVTIPQVGFLLKGHIFERIAVASDA